MDEFSACLQGLDDPRVGNAGRHELLEILMIALCTTLCGGQTAVDMAEFGLAKEGFLRRFLTLKNGIPGHDTFFRVFQLLGPDQFRACFQTFMQCFTQAHKGVVAINSKVLRRSFDKAAGKSPLHMVSAWDCEQGLVLVQIAVDEKLNEISAVPKLLKMLCLSDAIISVDALNCQRNIAKQIVAGGGNYVLR